MRWRDLANFLCEPKEGVGAMKRIAIFDQDDLTLVVAMLVSAVAISLALF
jgi:hypothetical protein